MSTEKGGCHRASLWVMCGQHVESRSRFGFINGIYCFQSIATKMSYDAGLSLAPVTDRKLLPIENRTRSEFCSTSLNHYNLNCLITESRSLNKNYTYNSIVQFLTT